MIEKLPFQKPLPETKLAIDAAKKAAKSVMDVYKKDFSTSLKDDKEPITEADIKSNQIIENTISTSGYPILSEESSDQIEKRLDAKKIWIVDPLDGTTDFVNKTGEFTIMIALVENNIPILGVISRPTEHTLYISEKGKGAFQFFENQWKQLQVSQTSDLPSVVTEAQPMFGAAELKLARLLYVAFCFWVGCC